MNNNPLLIPFNTAYQSVPFDKIEKDHFIPAITTALKEAKIKIEGIKNNLEKPTFENTILAFEESGEQLELMTSIYFNLYSIHSDDEFKALAQQINPMLSNFNADILTDWVLFKRVQAIYLNQTKKNKKTLSNEQFRLLEKIYKDFIRNGALLSNSEKQKVKQISEKMSKLSPQFSTHLLSATNQWEIHVTEAREIEGIPENALSTAAQLAKKQGEKEGWIFNLQAPSFLPVITYAKHRPLREKIYKAYSTRCFKDDFDNQDTVLKMASLRDEKAKILGYHSHAEFILEERMAETVHRVQDFQQEILNIALPAAKRDLEDIKELAFEMDGLKKIDFWDSNYYMEKLKQRRFDFDSEELRAYLKCENVLKGIFKIASKMYSLNFIKTDEVESWHKDVEVFKVLESDGEMRGLLYVDLFPRKTKQPGAWMNRIRIQGNFKGEKQLPHILISANLTPSVGDSPSLLSINDARTLFHEFGHALHGLLSNVTFTSLASPNVLWDFVELPSQIMENWLLEKEALSLFAFHHETGALIPAQLIEKLKASQQFAAGTNNIRQISFGLLDMAWHSQFSSQITDVYLFEIEAMNPCKLIETEKIGCMSVCFAHIFSGGYSAGYYSYKWAQALDADAFELFQEKGIFNPEVCQAFKKLLACGNSRPPMALYREFRGRPPDPKALLRRDGLI